MAKSNLREGDIVVVEIVKSSIDTVGTELLLTGIGKRYELYQYLLPNLWDDMIKAYPSYVKKNLERWLNQTPAETGAYSLGAYDERGNMTYERPACIVPEPFTEEVAERYGHVYYGEFEMEPAFREYLRQYVADCAGKNIPVYFSAVCSLDEAVVSTKEDAEIATECWNRQLPAPFISHQSEYMFSREYIDDYIQHCNSEGKKHRTELLYHDLLPYLSPVE